MNENITNKQYAKNMDHELDVKLDVFDQTISETFGSEVSSIKHFIYTERISYTTVKFPDLSYIGFKVGTDFVAVDTYMADIKRIRKAFEAFNIELPFWLLRNNA